ncbi:MAG: IMS domain-containing protein [Desertifilum sp.]|nr:IMS domain-containing protein [Desertifilum sp.]
MRIPLDYYRILGLPIQANADQLQQAHRDRAMQLPRREYSEVAIAARKQLIDEAYVVLSNPEQRQAYDATFLGAAPSPETESETPSSPPPSSTAEPFTPSLNIDNEQLVGALLILLELGEYELVLKYGRPSLNSKPQNAEKDQQLARADIVLTLALACMELGREQWQQGSYENAAESLETGQKLLLQEGLFASVRGEIQADIYKLRPYRILELVAQPEEKATQRRKGIQMLRDMLQERGGIDGPGNDQSGLGIDDFLLFIQQLRGYLTAKEQQSIFETEALRPSAVATYLAVYALLAQGFAEHKPALIARSKRMLVRLGSRQDVHLEQAVCALLLGQTEEASRALELSQEYEPLAFIREHSQGSPDLLPGLCLYGERWLQEEVFPHFRDLKNRQSSLKDYFADERIQTELEALPSESEEIDEWAALPNQRATVRPEPTALKVENGNVVPVNRSTRTSAQTATPASERQLAVVGGKPPLARGGTATLTPNSGVSSRPASIPPHPPNGRSSTAPTPPNRAGRSPKNSRFLLIGAVGILGLGLLLFLVSRTLTWLEGAFSEPLLQGEQPQVQLDRPPVEIPDPDLQPTTVTGELNQQSARQIVQSWLDAKSEALGQEHRTERLEEILVDPALSRWRSQSQQARQENWYAEHEHSLQIESVEMSQLNPNQGFVEAIVSEKATFFENGQLDSASSYNDPNLRVRYELIRQDNQWRIQDMVVLR